ncbi:microfibrillar-associated protein 1, partial [Tremellales sp. Uapishka_1]
MTLTSYQIQAVPGKSGLGSAPLSSAPSARPLARKPLRIAVVGAGPGGLAFTIFAQRLNNVEISVYDQARELKEVGAGISINQNTWRLLRLLGAAEAIEQYTSRGDGTRVDTEHRNGRTGAVLGRHFQAVDPDSPPRSRIERYKLQKALLAQIPRDSIQLGKKLSQITETPEGIYLSFPGETTRSGPFDLLVGADGIRSVRASADVPALARLYLTFSQVVRQHAFPEHRLSYTGKVAYRTLIPASKVAHIPDLPQASCFWHTPTTHVYTCFLDNGLFEIATRAIESEEHGAKVSWGQVAQKEQVVGHYSGYCDAIKAVIDAPDSWLEFAIFGGDRLDTVVHGDRTALLGDASHPLSGAFGSGAAFAFEDAYTLVSAIEYVQSRGEPISRSLAIYDEVRSPHYTALYEVLDTMGQNAQAVKKTEVDGDAIVEETIKRNWKGENGWIYTHDITKTWSKWMKAQQSRATS